MRKPLQSDFPDFFFKSNKDKHEQRLKRSQKKNGLFSDFVF